MKTSVSLLALLAASTAALGGMGLLASYALDGGMRPATARAVPADAAVALCHTPASAASTRDMIRLAASQTEVPPAEIKAATPAPAFADKEPPLWESLGTVAYKITTSNPEAQAYFDQGLRLTYAFNHG